MQPTRPFSSQPSATLHAQLTRLQSSRWPLPSRCQISSRACFSRAHHKPRGSSHLSQPRFSTLLLKFAEALRCYVASIHRWSSKLHRDWIQVKKLVASRQRLFAGVVGSGAFAILISLVWSSRISRWPAALYWSRCNLWDSNSLRRDDDAVGKYCFEQFCCCCYKHLETYYQNAPGKSMICWKVCLDPLPAY